MTESLFLFNIKNKYRCLPKGDHRDAAARGLRKINFPKIVGLDSLGCSTKPKGTWQLDGGKGGANQFILPENVPEAIEAFIQLELQNQWKKTDREQERVFKRICKVASYSSTPLSKNIASGLWDLCSKLTLAQLTKKKSLELIDLVAKREKEFVRINDLCEEIGNQTKVKKKGEYYIVHVAQKHTRVHIDEGEFLIGQLESLKLAPKSELRVYFMTLLSERKSYSEAVEQIETLKASRKALIELVNSDEAKNARKYGKLHIDNAKVPPLVQVEINLFEKLSKKKKRMGVRHLVVLHVDRKESVQIAKEWIDLYNTDDVERVLFNNAKDREWGERATIIETFRHTNKTPLQIHHINLDKRIAQSQRMYSVTHKKWFCSGDEAYQDKAMWYFVEGESILRSVNGRGKPVLSVDFEQILNPCLVSSLNLPPVVVSPVETLSKSEFKKGNFLLGDNYKLKTEPFTVVNHGGFRQITCESPKFSVYADIKVFAECKLANKDAKKLTKAVRNFRKVYGEGISMKSLKPVEFKREIYVKDLNSGLEAIDKAHKELREMLYEQSAAYIGEKLHEGQPYNEILPSNDIDQEVVIYVGQTNSGKTFRALQDTVAQLDEDKSKKAVVLSPLRALAMQIQDDIAYTSMYVEDGLPCSLITGEEIDIDENARCTSQTTESYNPYAYNDIVVIDEAQLLFSDRSPAFVKAIIGGYAKKLVLTVAPEALNAVTRVIETWVKPKVLAVHECERRSELTVINEPVSLDEVRKGDCVIAFGRKDLFNIAGRLKARGLRVCMLYGGMSPRSRKEMLRTARSGDHFDVLVASDAIAMGLNLPIKRVIFSTLSKFDGRCYRNLSAPEIRQIAGRAGRNNVDGQCGVMTNAKSHNGDALNAVNKAVLWQDKKLKQNTENFEITPFIFEIQALMDMEFSVSESVRVWAKIAKKPFSACNRGVEELAAKAAVIEGFGELTPEQQSKLLFVTFPTGGRSCELAQFKSDLRRVVSGEPLVKVNAEPSECSIKQLEKLNKSISRWSQIQRVFPDVMPLDEIQAIQEVYGDKLCETLIAQYAR